MSVNIVNIRAVARASTANRAPLRMCARRFLIIVFFLTLIVVAGAFAIFQFGQQVLVSQATPRGPFPGFGPG